MNRIEAEWIVAFAIVQAGLLPRKVVLRDSKLNAGQKHVMFTCRDCGRLYHSTCIPCTYRHGGEIHEDDPERSPDDLVDELYDASPNRLASTFRWMQLQTP